MDLKVREEMLEKIVDLKVREGDVRGERGPEGERGRC